MPKINLIQLAHQRIAEVVQPGDLVVDGTVGNGHDTLFLAQAVGPQGWVLGFDIQTQAIEKTQNRLREHNCHSHVCLLNQSHAELETAIQQVTPPRRFSAAMFNLGYLPGSPKTIITEITSTIQALQTALTHLVINGRISVLLYTGHLGGREETEAVKDWAHQLEKNQVTCELIIPEAKSASPPELLIITKTQ